MNEPYLLFEKIVVRMKPLLTVAATAAVVIAAHLNLLPLSRGVKDIIELICLIIIALVNPPVSRYVDPRIDKDLGK